MADLDNDTALTGADGTYGATITEEWRLLAPSGGFLSALALRAGVSASQFKRPVTYYCHYLNPAEEGEVELSVTSLRSSRRVESLRVDADQNGRRVAEAMVWTAQPGDGVDYDTSERPDVEPPDAYQPIETYVPDWPPFPFWRNFDYRPIRRPGQDPSVPGRAALRTWIRFRPAATFAAGVLAAARLLILADTFVFPAAQMAHARWPPPFWGVSLDLAVTIHDPGVEAEWLLVDAETPLASGGIMGGWVRIWSEDGRLLASSVQQMLQRAF